MMILTMLLIMMVSTTMTIHVCCRHVRTAGDGSQRIRSDTVLCQHLSEYPAFMRDGRNVSLLHLSRMKPVVVGFKGQAQLIIIIIIIIIILMTKIAATDKMHAYSTCIA